MAEFMSNHHNSKEDEGIHADALHMPVKGDPYDHQREAYDFVCTLFGLYEKPKRSSGACLLMEMGTGKSLVAIAVTGRLLDMGLIERTLIVCPLSVMNVWEEELAKFADFPYEAVFLRGTRQQKKDQLARLPGTGHPIVITNYENVWRLEPELMTYHPDFIIADEGHRLKDGTTRQSRTMHRLGDQAAYRLLLTGTAITNREIDIFSEYRFAAPHIFGKSFRYFRDNYFHMGGYGGHVPIFQDALRDSFSTRVHAVAYRVRKEECLDLPDVTEEIRTVDLEPAAMQLYRQIREESFAELRDSEINAHNVLTRTLRLSQITGGHLTDDNRQVNQVSTAKLAALSDIVDSMRSEDRKLVIMVRFTAELDDIEEMLRKKGIRYACIRGGVKNRAEQVRQFQNNPACTVFLGQIAAAGVGLTLTRASTMVFYSLSYNMADFDQAKARIHRVSQTENCHYIYLCCRDTIDFRVLHALQHKIDLARAIIDDFRNAATPSK